MNGLNASPPAADQAPIFERLAALADPLRCRLLLVLEGQELAVAEICSVLQLPQSTASRHLKILLGDGWITGRREGTRRLYAAWPDRWEPGARGLWALVREEASESLAAGHDRRRLAAVLAGRRSRSQEFFSSTAGEWSRLRRELFGHRFDLQGLLGLVGGDWLVGDLGCGTGQTTAALAPFVRGIVAVDESEAMLAAARDRLAGAANVELRQGRLEALPLADAELDAAVAILVLHHLTDPARALREAARGLRPGGRLVVVDMLRHDREEYRQRMGHVWLGFEEEQITAWLREAGFERLRSTRLPPDPEARGPALFVLAARRRETDAGGATGARARPTIQ